MAIWEIYTHLKRFIREDSHILNLYGEKKKTSLNFWNLLFTDNGPWVEF